MRSSNKRSRSKSNRPKPLGNIINRVFDSSGPEGKVRGTPQQIIEKYLVLARDAQLSGDRVAAENFLQHAEHYTRMLSEAQRELAREAESRQQHNNNNQPRRFEPRDEGEGGDAATNAQPGAQSGAQSDALGAEASDRQNDRQNERSGDAGGRRNSRRDGPRPQRQPQRDQTDPREAPASAAPSQDETDSMLVETPESRAETRPEMRPEARPEAQAGLQTAPASDAPEATASEAKPRKPRSTTNRRAPRKPKSENESTASGAESPRAAE